MFRSILPEHEYDSAGTNEKICRREGTTLLTKEAADWADVIVVMERKHLDRIAKGLWREYVKKSKVLNIRDVYKEDDRELKRILLSKIGVMGLLLGTGYISGHEVRTEDGMSWHYVDNGAPNSIEEFQKRPCVKCGKAPTADGHDACIANLPGVAFACCGHGIDGQDYVKLQDGGRMSLEEYYKTTHWINRKQ